MKVIVWLAVAALSSGALPSDGEFEEVRFLRGGDDGLTNRLYDAVSRERLSVDASCLEAVVEQVRPLGGDRFDYVIQVRECGADQLSEMATVVRGTCDSSDLAGCAIEIRSRIATTVAERNS